jgi:integrase
MSVLGSVTGMDDSQKVTGKPAGARPNREGKPWKRADGRWCARAWPQAKDTSGPPRPRYVYGKTRREVIEKRDALIAKLARGLPKDPDQTTGDYMRRWLDVTLRQYVDAGELAQSTADSYRDNAELHIIPADGPTLRYIKLAELSVPVVREWQHRLAQKPSGRPRRKLRKGETALPPPPPLSLRTVAYCRSILHKALEDALRDETAGLVRNPVRLVKPPKKRQKKAKPTISPADVSALLLAMSKDRMWCYWLAAFALGFRRGEGLGMRWQDIDLEKRVWTPQMSVQRVRGEAHPDTGRRRGRLVAKELKSEASLNPVAIPVAAAEALAAWQRDQRKQRMAAQAWADELDLVFTTGLGTAIEPRTIDRAWERLCDRAGVPRVRLHDLRHACASYLLAAGVDLKTVQATLRHAHGSTTQMYLHALEEVPRTAADTMDTILAKLRPGRAAKQSPI